MKIGIDTFGCEHGKSGLGSYLINFISHIDSNITADIDLFGAEIDRYTYKSEKEFTFTSINIEDSLKAEKKWHKRRINIFIRRQKYDVVIFPAIEKVFPKKFPVKSVAVVNSIFSVILEQNGKRRVHQIKKGLMKVNKIIAASNFIKEDLIKNDIPEDKITVIHNGIDHKMFFPMVNSDSDFVEIKPFAIKRPYFVYGSSLSSEDKKHIQLIKAFELFKDKTNAPHRLVISGIDGDYSSKVHETAYNSKYSCDIFTTGFIPHENFAQINAGASACVFPSVSEGVGLPILEAMACGVPVCCSSNGALKEIGGDVPFYFNSDDIYDIADKLEQVVKNEALCKSKITEGLERSKTFSWNITVENTFKIIMNL